LSFNTVHLPFRHIWDDAPLELLKMGAKDYILKDNIKRLPSVVQRVLDESKINRFHNR